MLQSTCHLQELQMGSDLLRNKVASVFGNSSDSICLLPIGHLLIYMMTTEQIECWTKDVTSWWRSIQLLFSSTAFLHIRYSLKRCLILWYPPNLSTITRTDNCSWSISQSVTGTQGGNLITQQQVDAITTHYITGKLRIIHTIFQISYDAKGPITPYMRRHYRPWDI